MVCPVLCLFVFVKGFMLERGFSIVGAAGFMLVVARTGIGGYYGATVPREVRKLLELRENDEIEWVFENSAIHIRKAQR
ncbi:MAG: AbrB/MazE/SpoVT family DNA-binding domain-containing protein [Desulfurococcaceae archaeon]